MKSNSNKDTNIVKTLILGWKETRLLTIEWINFQSIKTLRQKLPRVGLDTYAKHLMEMSEVQKAYINVLYGKNLNFSQVDKSLLHSDIMTKNQIINKLKREDKRLYKAVNIIKNWNKPVALFNKKYPVYYIIELLIRHETFHHGQFIAFCYSMNLKFPKSWKDAWALP